MTFTIPIYALAESSNTKEATSKIDKRSLSITARDSFIERANKSGKKNKEYK